MKLLYDGKEIGEIITNRALSVEEACESLNIDMCEIDEMGDAVWDCESFELDYN